MDQQTQGDAAAVGLAAPPVAHLSADGRGGAAPRGTADAAEGTTDSRDVAGGTRHEARAAITRVGFADVLRVDAERREIELCATSEAVDSYDTVFSYEASKDAFHRWTGNVREMHDPRKAVGMKVGVRCDDAEQRIYVRVRISRGAEDTWQKVLDGTLRGASIGARNVHWQKRLWPRDGDLRSLDVAVRYDLVELSLVDNPSNPDALGVTIVRDAVPDAALLDSLDGDAPVDADEARGRESLRVGASHAPADGQAPRREPDEPAHGSGQAHPFTAATSANPGSAEATLRTPAPLHGRPGKDAVRPPHNCAAAATAAGTGTGTREAAAVEAARDRGPFSANEQGYPDVGVPARAEEPPTSALGMTPEGNARQRFHDALLGIAQGCGCALCAMAAALYDDSGAERDEGATVARGQTFQRGDASLVRALAASAQSSTARLDAVQAGIRDIQALVREAAERTAGANADLRRRLDALEAQPLPGGPAARPMEKTLALAPHAARGEISATRADDAIRALHSLAGRLTDPQAQIAVAAELIRLQQER